MHNSRPRKIQKFWAPPLHLKNPAHNDCADWCLVSSNQLSAQSDKYCRLWIDLKISRCGSPQRPMRENRNIQLQTIVRIDDLCHPTKFQHNRIRTAGCESIWRFQEARLWEEIAKSGTERICAPMASIILPTFNLVGHVIREGEKCKETDGQTPDPFYKVTSEKWPDYQYENRYMFHRLLIFTWFSLSWSRRRSGWADMGSAFSTWSAVLAILSDTTSNLSEN